MTSLVLQGLRKTYHGGAEVLKPLDLAVPKGELLVLVGPSGCGKSTLLKLIAGLEPATAGRIFLDGSDISALEPRRRGIAMVFQNYALYPHLTVAENLAYPLRRAGTPRADIAARVAATAAQLRLTDLLRRRPAQLSGGQKQRVAMGRAIIRRPALFLLDEPLSNLDAELRAHMRGEIRALQRALNTTMLYVTHDQVEAQTLGDRVALLRDGCVQQLDAPREIYARPANLFAASFLGTPPIGLLPATLDQQAGAVIIGGRSVACAIASREQSQPVIVGVRPESWMIATAEAAFTLEGTVVEREHVGGTQYVSFVPDGPTLPDDVARLTGGQPTSMLTWATDGRVVGARVRLHARPQDVLIFSEDGRFIGPAG